MHSWNGYKKHAWLQDQVTPVTGAFKNDFGKRGATLIDALDTLIVMGLDKEFLAAIKAVKKIDFTTSAVLNLNVFETTIRYLGGLLGAYDLSDSKQHVLLDKAIELGDMLYAAFDTPNRLPITRWDWETCVAPFQNPSQTDKNQWCSQRPPGSRVSSNQRRVGVLDS